MSSVDSCTKPAGVPSCIPSCAVLLALALPLLWLCVQMLDEIQAGIFDGWTYEQIEQQMPQEFVARKKDKLKYRCAFVSVCLVIVTVARCMCSWFSSACLWLMAYL